MTTDHPFAPPSSSTSTASPGMFKVHTAADPHFFGPKENLPKGNALSSKSKLGSTVGAPSGPKRPTISTSSSRVGAPSKSTTMAPPAAKRPNPPRVTSSSVTKNRRASSKIGQRSTFSTVRRGVTTAAPKPPAPPTMTRDQLEKMNAMLSQFPEMSRMFMEVKSFVEKQAALKVAETEGQEAKIRDQEARLHTLVEDREKLTDKIGGLKRKVSDLQEERQTLASELEMYRTVATKRQEEIRELTGRIVKLSEEFEARLTEVTAISESRANEIAQLQATLTQRDAAVREMGAKLVDGESLRRKLHNQVQDLRGNIRVFCRVRPATVAESGVGMVTTFDAADDKKLDISETTLSVVGAKQVTKHSFAYDRVFGPAATQEEIFQELSQFVQSALDGYSCCIFAYGQTGSGKTFTMEGPSRQLKDAMVLSEIRASSPERGVIPRAVEQIFTSMAALRELGWQYSLEVSFVEVYNETLRDLLVPQQGSRAFGPSLAAGAPTGGGTTTQAAPQIKHDSSGRAYVTDAKVVPVASLEQVFELLNVARENRTTAATRVNDYSSRSHSVFQLRITGRNESRREKVSSVLNLVDLAGSEKLDTGSGKPERQKETVNINQSLSQLRNVILALAEKKSHVPYRDSMLTQLLQSSLGGEAKMLMFVNVSPSATNVRESIASLRFASTANKCHIGTVQRQAASV